MKALFSSLSIETNTFLFTSQLVSTLLVIGNGPTHTYYDTVTAWTHSDAKVTFLLFILSEPLRPVSLPVEESSQQRTGAVLSNKPALPLAHQQPITRQQHQQPLPFMTAAATPHNTGK